MENKRKIDPMGLFWALYTGFLEADYIRALPPENVYEEQVLDLRDFSADAPEIPCPAHITFETAWTKEPGRLQSMGSQTVRHN